MKLYSAVAFAAGVLFTCAGAGAQAGTIVTLTLSGPLDASGSHFDVFDLPSPSHLQDEPAKLTFTFDLGQVQRYPFLGGEVLQGEGSAVLTVNHHSFEFSNSRGYLNVLPDEVSVGLGGTLDNAYYRFNIYDPGTVFTPAKIEPFSLSPACSLGHSFLSVCLGLLTVAEPGAVFDGDINLHASTLQLSVSQTPVPPSLPLFAVALGGLGMAGWRRMSAGRA